MTQFAVSGQHYLFNVQTFASVVLANGGEEFEYAFRDRSTRGVIDDVASGESEIGVLVETTRTAEALEREFAEEGLEFVELIESAPRVALPASHPLVNAKSLTLEQLEDYPYLYFEQEAGVPVFHAEEALADEKRHKASSSMANNTTNNLFFFMILPLYFYKLLLISERFL